MTVFFFNDPATTEIYTLSLHDALPISLRPEPERPIERYALQIAEQQRRVAQWREEARSEEHTSELQSHHDLVCRLLLEKKKSRRRAEVANVPRPDLPPDNGQGLAQEAP